MSGTASQNLIKIKEGSSNALDQIGITTIPEINMENSEVLDTGSSHSQKPNLADQIDSSKLDTLVPNPGLISANHTK